MLKKKPGKIQKKGVPPDSHIAPLHDEGLEHTPDDSELPHTSNPFYPKKHKALFGETRSGKSMKMAHLIVDCLNQGADKC
jgi:hypothetical protein